MEEIEIQYFTEPVLQLMEEIQYFTEPVLQFQSINRFGTFKRCDQKTIFTNKKINYVKSKFNFQPSPNVMSVGIF